MALRKTGLFSIALSRSLLCQPGTPRLFVSTFAPASRLIYVAYRGTYPSWAMRPSASESPSVVAKYPFILDI